MNKWFLYRQLSEERGKVPPGHSKWEDYGRNLTESMFPYVRKRSVWPIR